MDYIQKNLFTPKIESSSYPNLEGEEVKLLMFLITAFAIHFFKIWAMNYTKNERDLLSGIASLIKKLMPIIEKGKANDAITWVKGGRNCIFRLEDFPSLIIKGENQKTKQISRGNQWVQDRLEKAKEAKRVCVDHHFTHLTIPRSRAVQIEGIDWIVEEHMDIRIEKGAQKQIYQ
jgi:hypothetical protein